MRMDAIIAIIAAMLLAVLGAIMPKPRSRVPATLTLIAILVLMLSLLSLN